MRLLWILDPTDIIYLKCKVKLFKNVSSLGRLFSPLPLWESGQLLTFLTVFNYDPGLSPVVTALPDLSPKVRMSAWCFRKFLEATNTLFILRYDKTNVYFRLHLKQFYLNYNNYVWYQVGTRFIRVITS